MQTQIMFNDDYPEITDFEVDVKLFLNYYFMHEDWETGYYLQKANGSLPFNDDDDTVLNMLLQADLNSLMFVSEVTNKETNEVEGYEVVIDDSDYILPPSLNSSTFVTYYLMEA